jgi:hypothetical protein
MSDFPLIQSGKELMATDPLDLEGGTVYGLIDPESRELRYIGKTTETVRKRLYAHLNEARIGSGNGCKDEKTRWLAGLIERDLEPEVVILAEPEAQKSLGQSERHWIVVAATTGGFLVNQITYAANQTLDTRKRLARVEACLYRVENRLDALEAADG